MFASILPEARPLFVSTPSPPRNIVVYLTDRKPRFAHKKGNFSGFNSKTIFTTSVNEREQTALMILIGQSHPDVPAGAVSELSFAIGHFNMRKLN